MSGGQCARLNALPNGCDFAGTGEESSGSIRREPLHLEDEVAETAIRRFVGSLADHRVFLERDRGVRLSGRELVFMVRRQEARREPERSFYLVARERPGVVTIRLLIPSESSARFEVGELRSEKAA